MNKIKKRSGQCPVMKIHCKTCPFKPNEKGIFQDMELANMVIERNFLKSQQICHGTEGKNREWNNRCKGAFDYFRPIYERLGIDVDRLEKGE